MFSPQNIYVMGKVENLGILENAQVISFFV